MSIQGDFNLNDSESLGLDHIPIVYLVSTGKFHCRGRLFG